MGKPSRNAECWLSKGVNVLKVISFGDFSASPKKESEPKISRDLQRPYKLKLIVIHLTISLEKGSIGNDLI
jgi:hypothetical protein